LRKVVRTDQAALPLGPYEQACIAGNLVFTAGQLGIAPGSKQLVEGGIAAQTRQALQNIAAILNAAGSGPDCVVKTTVFLTKVGDSPAMNTVYQEFFHQPYPARATVVVAALAMGALIEIDAVATMT
jgi:2-iminobutanoate/2-iminopropanoate deaminase